MSCDSTCRGCRYSSVISMGICCDYYLVHGVGHRRGCKAGRGCTRREAGPKAQTIEQRIQSIGRKKPPKPKKPREISMDPANVASREYNRRSVDRMRERLQGRQRAAIIAYRDEHNTTLAQMARDIGVTAKCMQTWAAERSHAKWDKLAELGITRPEGL